ncbi:Glycogen synthase [Plesiomonas shigelloides]|uniref:glycosyltransferase n=1 Tax=Plesiomonas shigelloides TaxID=703 RepID=UPI000D984D98|nr:glycosyltransferase [Plesiomonas shigelloides]SPZ44093.1 Glycogen synthase [Plesiomonas shigelloides]
MSRTPSDTLHILHLIDLRKVGGVETMFCDFVRQSATPDTVRHSVLMDHAAIAAPLQPRLATQAALQVQDIKRLSFLKLPNRPKLFRAWNRLRMIRDIQPDVILVWNQFTEWHLSAKQVQRYLPCPVVYYEHGMSWYQHRPTLPQRFFAHVDHCIAVSHAAKRMLELKHQVSVPIDVEFNAPRLLPAMQPTKPLQPGKPLIFGSAGRMVPLKCLGLLLFTVVELNKLGRPCPCYIAGDGPERNYLEQTIAVLGISEQVTLLGHIDDMASFYRQLDVYVCPSMHETGPLAALEAGAYGLPTITSYVDGLPEVVLHERTGLCLSPELSVEQYAELTGASTAFSPLVYRPDLDCLTAPTMLAPQQIAQAVLHLCENPQRYAEMSRAAQQHAKNSRNFADLSHTLVHYLSKTSGLN